MTTAPIIIHAYTAADAITDGLFINPADRLGEDFARQIGLSIPVYLTAGVWGDLVTVPEAAPWQDEMGRAWDIFTMLRVALMRARGESCTALVVCATPADASEDRWAPTDHKLWAELGDDPEVGPHIVVMWPHER